MPASSSRERRKEKRHQHFKHTGVMKKAKRSSNRQNKHKQYIENDTIEVQDKGRVVNPKFERHRPVPLLPKTERQQDYMDSLLYNVITIATGHAGSGKSYVASYRAAELYCEGLIDKIFITRPYAHLGTDYGATPGSDFEKLESFVRPMLDALKKAMGEGKYNYCIDNGIIEVAPLEKIQGRSFDEPCVLICDEAQNASRAQLISLSTRIGSEIEYLAICGDPRQSIVKGYNALEYLTDFFERNKIPNVGVVRFTEEDCVRSGIVKDILIALEKEGGYYADL